MGLTDSYRQPSRRRDRQRERVRGFAAAQGWQYSPDPPHPRPVSDVFCSEDKVHLHWLGVPGPIGFRVAQLVWVTSTADDSAMSGHWTYATFALRGWWPYLVIQPRSWANSPPWALRHVDPITPPGGPGLRLRTPKPYGPRMETLLSTELIAALQTSRPRCTLEIIADELIISTPRRLDLTATRTWRWMRGFQQILAPHLARPRSVTALAHRRRAGTRLALETDHV